MREVDFKASFKASPEFLAAFYVKAPPTYREWCHNTQSCRAGASLLGWPVVEKAWRTVWYNDVSQCVVCRKFINYPDGIPRRQTR